METPRQDTQNENGPKLSPRQALLAKALLNGENPAGIYSSPQTQHGAVSDIRAKFAAGAEAEGLTARELARVLKRKLTATKTKLFAHEGVIKDAAELEDHGAQLTAVEIAGRFLGLGRDQNAGTIVNGNVLVAWTGDSPAWIPQQCDNNTDTVTIPVAEPPRPRSRSEGTGSGRGRPPHIHSGKNDNSGPHIRSKKKGKLASRMAK